MAEEVSPDHQECAHLFGPVPGGICLSVRRPELRFLQSDLLEGIVDSDLVTSINTLLHPSGGSPHLLDLSRRLNFVGGVVCTAYLKGDLSLLESDITDALYQMLRGVLSRKAKTARLGPGPRSAGLLQWFRGYGYHTECGGQTSSRNSRSERGPRAGVPAYATASQ
ncbi:hypothetical protein CALVIDRAFT_416513 [Calocera viscosa TUFC12733]|uniref:Uncharacterized protein n=1 Tax=Calocera viscosa (strain TUFC12733) TaxID=1330018 RepID=A0A167PEP6_CALVF|nr:hypothetical protein CALVIDRAFT_416513 [Calocera viscosa TUFC12733]